MLMTVLPGGPPPPTSPTGGVVKKMFAEPGNVPVSTGAGPGADGPFAANGLVPRLVPRNRTAALFTRLSTPPPLPRVSWAGAVRIREPGWTVTVAPPWKVTPAGFAPRVTAVGTLGWALIVSDPASASGVVAGMRAVLYPPVPCMSWLLRTSAPPATFTPLVLGSDPVRPQRVSVPLAITVAPVYVWAASRVRLPAAAVPARTRFPLAPWITPAKV